MLASSYPILDIFLTTLYFFIFIIWLWLLFMVFIDIFRSGKMHERAAQQAALQQKAFDQYVKQAAGTPGNSTADQLSKLAGLKSQGLLTDAEFDAEKTKILAG